MRITYTKSARSKRLRITVDKSGVVVVSVPRTSSLQQARAFILAKQAWIQKQVSIQRVRRNQLHSTYGDAWQKVGTRNDYIQNKEYARTIVQKHIAALNQEKEFTIRRIAIRNTATRWGSASSKGNLNFSYRIIYLPEELQRYVVVHELCHLTELNHSEKFWQLVARFDHKFILHRRSLRKYA